MIKTYDNTQSVVLSKNFKSHEFKCKCGKCKITYIDSDLVDFVQMIRTHFDAPIIINSGYRCASHNAKVGGSSKSQHVLGTATDISVKGVNPAEVAKYAESIGILGIGLYEGSDGNFVHIDTRQKKSFWYGHKQQYRSTFGGDNIVKQFQKAAIADKFSLPSGADGIWGNECEAVAKKALCKKPLIKGLYTNKNLTAFLQKQMGYADNEIDGKFWKQTEADFKEYQKNILGFTGKNVDGKCGYMSWKAIIRK